MQQRLPQELELRLTGHFDVLTESLRQNLLNSSGIIPKRSQMNIAIAKGLVRVAKSYKTFRAVTRIMISAKPRP